MKHSIFKGCVGAAEEYMAFTRLGPHFRLGAKLLELRVR